VLGLETYALKENICWFYVKWHKNCVVWRIRNVYPGSRILILTHFGSPNQKYHQKTVVRRKWFVKAFFVFTNFQNYALILDFICRQKKIRTIFAKLLNFLRKMSPRPQSLLDPWSGILKKHIPDPGSRIRIRNTRYSTLVLGYNI
jgi:hypothetical protein